MNLLLVFIDIKPNLYRIKSLYRSNTTTVGPFAFLSKSRDTYCEELCSKENGWWFTNICHIFVEL